MSLILLAWKEANIETSGRRMRAQTEAAIWKADILPVYDWTRCPGVTPVDEHFADFSALEVKRLFPFATRRKSKKGEAGYYEALQTWLWAACADCPAEPWRRDGLFLLIFIRPDPDHLGS